MLSENAPKNNRAGKCSDDERVRPGPGIDTDTDTEHQLRYPGTKVMSQQTGPHHPQPQQQQQKSSDFYGHDQMTGPGINITDQLLISTICHGLSIIGAVTCRINV